MFKVTGRIKHGAVYRDGKPLVFFRKGVGYVEKLSLDDIEYLEKRGYTVEGGKPAPIDPLAGLTAKELTAYAVDHGIDLTGVPNSKGKILAAIRAVEPLPTDDQNGDQDEE